MSEPERAVPPPPPETVVPPPPPEYAVHDRSEVREIASLITDALQVVAPHVGNIVDVVAGGYITAKVLGGKGGKGDGEK
jgi:hypothetical protein